jgi:hypothetical protein
MSKFDAFYPKTAAKPTPPRVVDGWRELPGGGWMKEMAPDDPHRSPMDWIISGCMDRAAPSRAADVFYGGKRHGR